MEDYLSAVAAGLIQFVCVREGREMYRSLTADRILIHPGSVMFRMDPQYIVAGEIIRTTRMYAMSVSPLSHEVLEKVSPELFEALGGRSGVVASGTERKKSGRIRDFTNTIKIGSEVFGIKTVKGKKCVILPWEKLSKVKNSIDDSAVYKGLKGTVVLDGRYTLFPEEKLSFILSLVPVLEIEGALSRVWPRKTNFNSRENQDALLEMIPLLVTPAIWKPGKNMLGFICLFTDGAGNYWFKCSRGFHTSLNESLSALETLIDELGDEVDIMKKHVVNQTYRRLSDYLG
jgi:hypothetical protein